MKYHYPQEYFTAILNYADFDDYSAIIRDAGRFGIKILPPDINASEAEFSPVGNDSIRFGLSNIKGIASYGKTVIESRSLPFKSFKDFMERAGTPKDVTTNLIYAGCFDRLRGNKNEQSLYLFRNDLLSEVDSEREKTDKIHLLFSEKSVLGIFLTGNPIEDYNSPNKISELSLQKKYYSIIGVVSDFKKKVTKTEKEMAVFMLSDDTGSINVCCFPTLYEQVKDMLDDDKILQFSGYVKKDDRDGDKETFVIQNVTVPQTSVSSLVLVTDKKHGAAYFTKIVSSYKNPDGIPVQIQVEGRLIPFGKVDKKIITDESVKPFVVIVR